MTELRNWDVLASLISSLSWYYTVRNLPLSIVLPLLSTLLIWEWVVCPSQKMASSRGRSTWVNIVFSPKKISPRPDTYEDNAEKAPHETTRLLAESFRLADETEEIGGCCMVMSLMPWCNMAKRWEYSVTISWEAVLSTGVGYSFWTQALDHGYYDEDNIVCSVEPNDLRIGLNSAHPFLLWCLEIMSYQEDCSGCTVWWCTDRL